MVSITAQRADVASKLAGAASRVFGWSDDRVGLLIVIGDMRDALDLQRRPK
jgi:hypothetical protein